MFAVAYFRAVKLCEKADCMSSMGRIIKGHNVTMNDIRRAQATFDYASQDSRFVYAGKGGF